jgi:aspartokinase-like uncharacterized kinase
VAESQLTVVKVGGAICRAPAALRQALDAIGRLGCHRPVLVVPGGGGFADQVRLAQRELGFSDDAAHWMAILAMDQVAHLLVDRLGGARLIDQPQQVALAHDAGQIPVLAPYAWMRAADALPRSWDVTSDSIAAFIADALGARDLILLKPVEGSVEELVDRAFAVVRPPRLAVRIATPATLETLAAE